MSPSQPKTSSASVRRKAPATTGSTRARIAAATARCAARVSLLARRACQLASRLSPFARTRVEVMSTDPARRRALSRAVRSAIGQLRRAVPGAPRLTAVVVAEHVAVSGRQLAGGAYVRRDADGTQSALLRLALSVDGRALSDDEVLAVLAEQWIGLAVEQGASCVVIPSEPPSGLRLPDPRRTTADVPEGDRDTAVQPASDDPLASLLRATSRHRAGRSNGSAPAPDRTNGLAA